MITIRAFGAALAATALLLSAACRGDAGASPNSSATVAAKIPVTITTQAGAAHVFQSEIARTRAEQDRGLMYRTDIGKDFGMIFWPYPAEGGPPREASFWMANTPTPLDIIFIRPDGTIARIAENTIPYSTDTYKSGEPVSAVLEILGGRSAELGIGPGDRVSWPGQGG